MYILLFPKERATIHGSSCLDRLSTFDFNQISTKSFQFSHWLSQALSHAPAHQRPQRLSQDERYVHALIPRRCAQRSWKGLLCGVHLNTPFPSCPKRQLESTYFHVYIYIYIYTQRNGVYVSFCLHTVASATPAQTRVQSTGR